MSPHEKLKQLYDQTSKHSNYQVLASSLLGLLEQEELEVKSRFEKERLKFILKHVDIHGKNAVDVGGNTGFFTFELIANGANELYYFEGNSHHAEFVKEAARHLGLADRVHVSCDYLDFKDGAQNLGNQTADIMLLLNVLHHVGDDYGNQKISVKQALSEITASLRSVASSAKTLVFQLGFCWKGNRELALFARGTKAEMIDFVQASVRDVWKIDAIGIPVRKNGIVSYVDPSPENTVRDDSLGEFLNRPLFILSRI